MAKIGVSPVVDIELLFFERHPWLYGRRRELISKEMSDGGVLGVLDWEQLPKTAPQGNLQRCELLSRLDLRMIDPSGRLGAWRMMLIETPVHKGFAHTGGFSIWNKLKELLGQ